MTGLARTNFQPFGSENSPRRFLRLRTCDIGSEFWLQANSHRQRSLVPLVINPVRYEDLARRQGDRGVRWEAHCLRVLLCYANAGYVGPINDADFYRTKLRRPISASDA